MEIDERNRLAIGQAAARLDKDAQYALQAAGVRMLETAREGTPRRGQKYATGQLGDSLRIDVSVPGKVTLFAGTDHAIFNEYGTGPRGQASGQYPVEGWKEPQMQYHGGVVLRRNKSGTVSEVHTMGMQARPYIRPAVEAGIAELKKALIAITKR